jgi:hypothetical protein
MKRARLRSECTNRLIDLCSSLHIKATCERHCFNDIKVCIYQPSFQCLRCSPHAHHVRVIKAAELVFPIASSQNLLPCLTHEVVDLHLTRCQEATPSTRDKYSLYLLEDLRGIGHQHRPQYQKDDVERVRALVDVLHTQAETIMNYDAASGSRVRKPSPWRP